VENIINTNGEPNPNIILWAGATYEETMSEEEKKAAI